MQMAVARRLSSRTHVSFFLPRPTQKGQIKHAKRHGNGRRGATLVDLIDLIEHGRLELGQRVRGHTVPTFIDLH